MKLDSLKWCFQKKHEPTWIMKVMTVSDFCFRGRQTYRLKWAESGLWRCRADRWSVCRYGSPRSLCDKHIRWPTPPRNGSSTQRPSWGRFPVRAKMKRRGGYRGANKRMITETVGNLPNVCLTGRWRWCWLQVCLIHRSLEESSRRLKNTAASGWRGNTKTTQHLFFAWSVFHFRELKQKLCWLNLYSNLPNTGLKTRLWTHQHILQPQV